MSRGDGKCEFGGTAGPGREYVVYIDGEEAGSGHNIDVRQREVTDQ